MSPQYEQYEQPAPAAAAIVIHAAITRGSETVTGLVSTSEQAEALLGRAFPEADQPDQPDQSDPDQLTDAELDSLIHLIDPDDLELDLDLAAQEVAHRLIGLLAPVRGAS